MLIFQFCLPVRKWKEDHNLLEEGPLIISVEFLSLIMERFGFSFRPKFDSMMPHLSYRELILFW